MRPNVLQKDKNQDDLPDVLPERPQGSFPMEVLPLVARHLALPDIKKLFASSLVLREAIERNPVIWKKHISDSLPPVFTQYYAQVKQEHYVTSSWALGKEKERKTIRFRDTVEIIKAKVYGDIVVVSTSSPDIQVFDMGLNRISVLRGHRGSIWAFDYGGRTLLTGSTDRTAKIWDCSLGICLKTLSGHTSTVRCVVFAGKYVVTGSRDATIRVWDAETGVCSHVLRGHSGSIRSLAAVPGKPWIVSGSYDGTAVLWNYRTGEQVRTLARTHRRVYQVLRLDMSPAQTIPVLAFGGMDQMLTAITAEGLVLFQSKEHPGTVFRIRQDKSGDIFTFTVNGVLSRWSPLRKSLVYSVSTYAKGVDIVVLNHLVVVGTQKQVAVYNKGTGAYIRTVAEAEQVFGVAATESRLFVAARYRTGTQLRMIEWGANK